MTRVTATDQILILLRERLLRNEKGRPSSARTGPARATPQQRILALVAAEDLPERDFRKAIVRGLLSERLGEALVADPAFEAVTGEVLTMIEDSAEGRELLDRAARELRAG